MSDFRGGKLVANAKRRCQYTQAVIPQRRIADAEIGALGLGCMGMSWAYGPAATKEAAERVLGHALELGINHWDTADVYGSGENERLVGPVVKANRDRVFLATKFGNVYDHSMTSHQDQVAQGPAWIVDGTPEYAKKCIDASLTRLGLDHVDLYYLHRIDPEVPVEETVGAMGDLVRAGKVRHIGISEASADTIRRAHKAHPLAAVQNELSLWTRDFVEAEVPLCAELGIAFVAYSPLGRGFLTGEIKSFDDLDATDARRNHPRFQPENFARNMELVDAVRAIAASHKATAAQVALAWTLAQGEHVVPIPGTTKPARLDENADALGLTLTAGDLEVLNGLSAAVGTRYSAAGMKFVKA